MSAVVSPAYPVTVDVTLTPQQLAESFWSMNSAQQADFFEALDRMAGIDLCFQMAFVVAEIRLRSDRGDYRAMNGFRTMLAHAEAYAEAALEMRCNDALRERIGGAA